MAVKKVTAPKKSTTTKPEASPKAAPKAPAKAAPPKAMPPKAAPKKVAPKKVTPKSDTAEKPAAPKAPAKKEAPKKAPVKKAPVKKAAPPKLSDAQGRVLSVVQQKKDEGYIGTKAESKILEALLGKKLVKRGKKEGVSYRYLVTKAGAGVSPSPTA
jgi:hypothetical protein